MVDAEADIFMISYQFWSCNWVIQEVPHGLSGIGSLPSFSVQQSARQLKCTDPEDQEVTFQSYVASMHLGLWPRILHEQWHALFNIPLPDISQTQSSEASHLFLVSPSFSTHHQFTFRENSRACVDITVVS